MRFLKNYFPVIIFLAIGFIIATEINGFLGITYSPKKTPESGTYSTIHSKYDSARTLGIRLIDMGGVGIIPDTINWGNNYEHNVHRFEDMIMDSSPFIDTAAFDRIEKELTIYVNRIKEFNYSGIVFPGFLEFVNFDSVGNGFKIYPQNNIYRLRHTAFRKYFSKLIEVAHQNGLKVYMGSDMATFTTPLKNYILKNIGKTDTENKEFWEIYQSGAKELFETMPGVDGLLIRIGEAGSVYNRPGWDYYSELSVTTDKGVQMMLNSFIEVAEKYNKLIIFRTWSVGVGQTGDLHTNTETYHRVLDTIHSNNLVVSTKYCSGDFYSWLPFNPTLSQGKHRRITEFQCRREFEGLNAFPNYLAPLHQQALQQFSANNKHFEGFWLWSQEGGPLRAGPLSIYPLHGFNVITDANVFATAKLAQNPFADLQQITNEWVRFYFGDDSLLANNITEMLLMSHDITRKGLYITEFAQYDIRALGLEPPPMMWIFEWDMVGASSSALGSIYYVCKPNLKAAVAEGYEAIEGVKKMKILVEASSGKASKNQADYTKLLASLDYQQNLFTVLEEYRSYFLHYYHWLDTGDEGSLNAWKESLNNYRVQEKKHQELYLTNLDFPSYNFREANVGVVVSIRNTYSAWVSRLLVLLILTSMLLPLMIKKELLRKRFGIDGMKQLWLTIMAPSFVSQQQLGKVDKQMVVALLLLSIVGGLISFTCFSAPLFFSFLLALIILYTTLLLTFYKSKQKINSLLLLAPSLLLIALPVVVSCVRGPMLFWYLFWTSEYFRLFFFSIFILCFLWTYTILFRTAVSSFKMSRIRAVLTLFLIQGIQFIVGAAIVLFVGFEKTLTIFNDEMLVLPGGLSRILGITTHLNIPVQLPVWVMYIGIFLALVGFVLLLIERKLHGSNNQNL
ncbi:MAG: hypothetical protein Q7W13_11305 [Bacteroidia bacterium]|nr:hypothetical protein [Bacteroidia bacterium]